MSAISLLQEMIKSDIASVGRYLSHLSRGRLQLPQPLEHKGFVSFSVLTSARNRE
jgi:hypothetical protein